MTHMGDTPPPTWVGIADQCTATSKASGERCRAPAIRSGTVCIRHGGAAPQVRAKARERLERQALEGEVGALLAEIGADDVHPLEALLDAVAQSHAMARLCGILVAGLGPHPEAGKAGLYGPDHLGDARPHALVDLHRRYLDLAARTSKTALDAGVDERRVRMLERDVDELVGFGERLVEAVSRAFVDAGVSIKFVERVIDHARPAAFRSALELDVVDSTAADAVPPA